MRRLRYAVIVLVSQLLLIGLAAASAIEMALIAANGSVYFVENNSLILWLEIALTISICIFGAAVFVMQLRRLGERRTNDDERDQQRSQ